MSSLDDTDVPSVSLQKLELGGYLNAGMLTMLWMGIYAIVYVWTFYIYLHRKAAHHISILGVITVIYVLSVVATAIYWYQTKLTFIDNGDTMLDAFNYMYNTTSFLDTITDTCQNLIIILADGLLMWRCCLVWTGSRRITWIPCVLWLIESMLAIAIIIAEITGLDDYTDARILLVNGLLSTLFFTSALTSLISTFLIAYRLYVASKFTGASKRRFKNVIDIVVQSSAVYTVSVIIVGIYNVIPFDDSASATVGIDTFSDYAGSTALVLTGMMPTLMVARVAMSSGKDSTTVVVSAGKAPAPGKQSAIHFQSRGADLRESWDPVEPGKPDLEDERWKKDVSQLEEV
ncbi:hypothetical protein CPC08DRAFT_706721 [Agrocybe pediades]|nr:hypothetical protein CPC08DRAFT_706721 [Agrocybe pediades]